MKNNRSLIKLLEAVIVASIALSSWISAVAADRNRLAPGVRGLATRAPANMKIDGDLTEFKGAFCTPVEYFNADLKNRAAQFFYMWDDEAFYAGLRTLDTKPFSSADDNHLWEGDAVEWYFDTRQNADFRSQAWPTNANPGAVHCYWSGLKMAEVQPRFCLRPGFLQAIPKTGVQVGARRTKVGMDVEFKLPWANFPNFKPKLNEIIALDAELCYSDGGPRIFRSFVYGSPLSVQQPASLGKIQLVDKLQPADWKACGPVMLPMRCDTAWGQNTKPQVTGYLALPPDQSDQIGKVIFRIIGLNGSTLGEYPGKLETFEPEGNFRRMTAQWPGDLATPGAHQLLGIVYDKNGKELARIAPRMVSVNMVSGY
ncbi:MAG: hypothetical protein HY298_04260 [Verrucomicrobia bacterium]|nr:hypothetical protein [Verrucomicrobiota bacterium]